MSSEDLLIEQRGVAGVLTLNRQHALNAVTEEMVDAIARQLDIWENNQSIERVVIGAAEGRAFSAGGDIRHLYEQGMAGNHLYDFFRREYLLNARIHAYPKPYVALVDGIAMGGGVGVSFHGSHVVAGGGMAFAMPEVGIGFFPDVGGSYLLSRLPGQIGLYLGLTGARIKQADAVWLGLADYAVNSERFPELAAALEQSGDTGAIIEGFTDDTAAPPLADRQGWIGDAFSASSVPEIIDTLQNVAANDDDQGKWAAETLAALNSKSLLSLAIAFRQIRAGRNLSMRECMAMEYRILTRILDGGNFYEGIRAAIIDKDQSPVWSPASLDEVTPEMVDRHFEPLGDRELFA